MLFIPVCTNYGTLLCKGYGADHGRQVDLKPTNILLELEDPQEKIEKYLSETPARMSTECGVTKPLREVIKTPLISEMNDPQIRIIDFGVGA